MENKYNDFVSNIQNSFKFLCTVYWLESLPKRKGLVNILTQTMNVSIGTPEENDIIPKSILEEHLTSCINNKNTPISYYTILFTIRNITSSIFQTTNTEKESYIEEFDKYLKETLNTQYENFIKIISIMRHSLSHNELLGVKIQNIDGIVKKNNKDKKIKLEINPKYLNSQFSQEYPENYTITFDIHLDKIQGKEFYDVFDIIHLYRLCHLCYNLTEEFYRNNNKTGSTTK